LKQHIKIAILENLKILEENTNKDDTNFIVVNHVACRIRELLEEED